MLPSVLRKACLLVLSLAVPVTPCLAQLAASVQQKSSPANLSLPTNQFAVDLNNDGVPDIVQVLFGNLTTQPQFTVSLANGDGTFKAPVTYTIPEQYTTAMSVVRATSTTMVKPTWYS